MSLIDSLALVVVALVGLYLLALGSLALVRPALATRFLLGFVRSLGAHVLELSLRLVVGAALVVAAPRLPFAGAFAVFGWVLLASTAVLLVLPWRWHQRFAQQAVPQATRWMAWIGWAALAAGAFVIGAVMRGGGA